MLSQDEVKQVFKTCDALWEGHFLFSSGLHSNTYIQCARVSQYPKFNELLCRELAEFFREEQVNAVLGPAMGGIIIAYELARQLNARALFTERVEGEMKLRRGMNINAGERVLVVEDVITTGGTVKELVPVVEGKGAAIVGGAAFVNRNVERVKFDFPFKALLEGVMEDYLPEDCPLCREGIPLIKPGSKYIK